MKNTSKKIQSDRFIPLRSQSTLNNVLVNKFSANDEKISDDISTNAMSVKKTKQLAYSSDSSTPKESMFDFLSSLQNSFKTLSTVRRSIPTLNCQKILEVPTVVDNFYFNPLDISKHNLMGIALTNNLFLFKQAQHQYDYCDTFNRDENITCVKFQSQGQAIFAGNEVGVVDCYDVEKLTKIRKIKNHYSRIGRIQMSELNPNHFYSGSKDYRIVLNDTRLKISCVAKLESHRSQVTGLSLKQNYLASGANDGLIKIWDIRKNELVQTLKNHSGAVKALSWCPWRSHTLASGGGRDDRTIVIFDYLQNHVQKVIQVKHQVTQICWRKSTQQMIYSYTGKDNKSSIKTNNYFNPKCVNKKLSGHQGKILAVKVNMNADNKIYSIAGDECLKYWNLDAGSNKCEITEIVHSHLIAKCQGRRRNY